MAVRRVLLRAACAWLLLNSLCSLAAPDHATAASAATGFTSLLPARIVETRPAEFTADGLFQGIGKRPAASTLEIDVLGRGGVPLSGVGSVVLNVAAVEPAAAGFVTVFPAGESLPTASNLNIGVGAVVSNPVVVKLGAGGRFSVYVSAPVHLVIDVIGWFPSSSTGFSGVVPARLLDSRPDSITVDGSFAGIGLRAAGSTTELDVSGRGGVPGSGVGAVVVNVTAVGPSSPGYVTVWPTGDALPTASSLALAAGEVRPNLVVVKLGDGGRISLFTSTGTHLVVDVVGWFSSDATDFTSFSPARLADSRSGLTTVDGVCAGTGTTFPEHMVSIPVLGRAGVPASGVGSVVLNVTAVQPAANGFGVVWPSDSGRPYASTLNFQTMSTVANLVIAKVGDDGAVLLYTSAPSHFVVDVVGYFSGSATAVAQECAGIFGKPTPTPAITLQYRIRDMESDGQFLWTTGNRYDSAGHPLGSYLSKIDPRTGATVGSRSFTRQYQYDIVDIDATYVYLRIDSSLYRVSRATVSAPQLVLQNPWVGYAYEIVVTPNEVLLAHWGIPSILTRVSRINGAETSVNSAFITGVFRIFRGAGSVWVAEWGAWDCPAGGEGPWRYMFSALNTTTLERADVFTGSALAFDGDTAVSLEADLGAGPFCGLTGSILSRWSYSSGTVFSEVWLSLASYTALDADEVARLGTTTVVLDRSANDSSGSGLRTHVILVPDDSSRWLQGIAIPEVAVGFATIGSTVWVATATGLYAIPT